MKIRISRFDSLVEQYYPAVYSLAIRLTDDPREAIELTRNTFAKARKQLSQTRTGPTTATVLLSAVLRAGMTAT